MPWKTCLTCLEERFLYRSQDRFISSLQRIHLTWKANLHSWDPARCDFTDNSLTEGTVGLSQSVYIYVRVHASVCWKEQVRASGMGVRVNCDHAWVLGSERTWVQASARAVGAPSYGVFSLALKRFLIVFVYLIHFIIRLCIYYERLFSFNYSWIFGWRKAFSALIAAIINYFPRRACFNEEILQHFQGLINPNPWFHTLCLSALSSWPSADSHCIHPRSRTLWK